ncbi:MAG TPA: hypothetical protein VFN35_34935, partial [Ktedonobacteraceae bacterium]|nr:hypothetical protein [Ktedonobacteraceae bacterium]
PSHTQTYIGPHLSGPDGDLAAVTLSFLDLRGNGRLDMIIHVQGSQYIFLNDGEKFVPVPADEEKQMWILHSIHIFAAPELVARPG